MRAPNIVTSKEYKKDNVVFHVLAYRKLSEREVVECIEDYCNQPSMRRRKTPLKNKEITIETVIGLRG